MFDFNKRVFILLGIVAALVMGIIFYFFYLQDNGEEEVVENQDTAQEVDNTQQINGGTTSTQEEVEDVVTETPEEVEDRYVKQLARIFVERFGSFTNEDPDGHIKAVEDMVTSRMWSWVRTQTVNKDDGYYGVTTRVIASRVTALVPGSATVDVEVQKLSENGGDRITEQKTGTVGLIKIGTEWKVDSIFWN